MSHVKDLCQSVRSLLSLLEMAEVDFPALEKASVEVTRALDEVDPQEPDEKERFCDCGDPLTLSCEKHLGECYICWMDLNSINNSLQTTL